MLLTYLDLFYSTSQPLHSTRHDYRSKITPSHQQDMVHTKEIMFLPSYYAQTSRIEDQRLVALPKNTESCALGICALEIRAPSKREALSYQG